MTYPFQRIKFAKVPPNAGSMHLLTYVYHLFPNVLITVLSRQRQRGDPGTARRSIDAADHLHLTHGAATIRRPLPEAKRDADRSGNTEPPRTAPWCQAIQRAALASGANEVFTPVQLKAVSTSTVR